MVHERSQRRFAHLTNRIAAKHVRAVPLPAPTFVQTGYRVSSCVAVGLRFVLRRSALSTIVLVIRDRSQSNRLRYRLSYVPHTLCLFPADDCVRPSSQRMTVAGGGTRSRLHHATPCCGRPISNPRSDRSRPSIPVIRSCRDALVRFPRPARVLLDNLVAGCIVLALSQTRKPPH